jgi:hypothetical protein
MAIFGRIELLQQLLLQQQLLLLMVRCERGRSALATRKAWLRRWYLVVHWPKTMQRVA